ncbi:MULTISPECIES: DUF1801 domain-containing protein [Paraliobacillus]|uniref:DUF1801 domain-containing protein n=1 Tax=Paraliobacillus TaxID=200903 RepID=UPI000DD316B0|nr:MULTISPECIES: DUF1801 domain-containing protein [Paraliobacillus]
MSMVEINKYLKDKEAKWQEAFLELNKTIAENIPSGFEFEMQYGMPSFVVPLSIFSEGYHCKSDTPLPFISIGIKKNHIAVYHMGIYADVELLGWFQQEYPKFVSTKLNMGKSCIRFTNPKKIPYALIGELVSKITVEEWIEMYKGNKV